MSSKTPSDRVLSAVSQGDVAAVNEAIAHGRLNVRDRDGRTPAMYAVIDGRASVLDALLASGADVAAADQRGWTALHYAAQARDASAADKLLRNGAPVDAIDAFGNTPLWRAVFASQGDSSVIKVLLAHKADPHRKNSSGVSPVELAKSIANFDAAGVFAGVE